MSWRIADTGEVIDLNYSQNRPKRLKTTINDDDSITIAPNTTNESLPKGWKLADENLQAPKGWRLADEPKPSANYSNFPNNSNSLTTPNGWRLADESVNSPKIEKRLSPNQEQITQSPTLQDFRQSFERLQNNPKNEFMDNKSTSQTPTIKEDYTPKDFFWDVAKGVDRGYMKIGAGINKALDKITPDYVQEYWEQKYKENPNLKNRIFHAMTDTKNNYYRNQYLINKDNEEIKNKYVGLGGEIAGDPTIMLPLGILGKTRGFKNTIKSGLAGAAIATPAGALKDYGDESVSNKQMMSNTLINALAGGGINSLLASKTGNVLVNKIANAYRSARGKEKVAYSNFRRGVEVPQAPEQTNSQFFENIKNVYDDIGIDTPLPKANIVPYDKAFAKNQAQNSEFIKGDSFRMQKGSEPQYQQEIIYPDEIKSSAVNEARQIPFNNEVKQIPFKSNLLPNQNLKAPITTDDIFKEAINLHKSGFKFGKDINENINFVLNKIKNDRLNATSAKNAQVPNNELLPQPKEPVSIKKEPLSQDEFYLNRANKYIDELEQKGLKPEYVAKLRNNALENPHRFSDEAIEKNEWFMKNNYDTLFNKQGKNTNMKGGFITPNLAKDMASSGIGAGIGANLDDENRLRGAMLGGLAGLGGRHMLSQMPNFIKSNNKNIYNIVKNPIQKEKRGIYNVAYNGKNSTKIKQDLSDIDDYIKLSQGNRKEGAKHIKIRHLTDETKQGYVTDDELMNVGVNMRIFLKNNKPFIDDKGARLYEWRDKNGVGFRLVVENKEVAGTPLSAYYTQPATNNKIITFYSDRNLKDPMKFKNPNLQDNNKMKGGFTTQAMAKNIVAGGIGGGIGAYSAPEDKKLEGFIIGALGGMGASNFGEISHSAVNLVKNMIKTPKGIDKAIEKGVDKGLVGVANKFLSKEAAKTWSDIGGNVGNIKYLFANTLDKSYEKVRDSVTGELNAMFNKYVNLSGVLNQLSKKDNKAFYDFLANNGSIENLSPEIRKFANDVRNQIIKEFEYQVGAKLVDENTAKEFSGNFLSRIYENEGLKSKFKDWISSGSSAFGIDPIYKRGLEKTIGIGEYQRLKALGKIAVKGDKGFSTGGKWILNEPYDEKTLLKMADENTKIKIRRDYTADERAKMGEVTDISRVLPQTLYKMASRRINNEFLSKTLELAKKTDKILAPDELLPHLKELQKAGNKREIMRLGYMQIPDNDRYGVLKGKFLRRDVAYDISQKIDSFRNKNLGTKIYTDYLNAWKWAKTVGNTTGHFNNFVGNAFLMKLAGIQTKELKGMVTNVGVLRDAGKFTELRMKEKLGNITSSELMWLNENRAKFKNYELASSVGLFGRSRLNDMGIDTSFTFKEDGVLRKIGKFANDMYGAEDDVARLTMFNALLKKGKTPQEAKEFTNLLMPDYTRYMPPAIRKIKDLGIAPFISWTYYVIPSVFKLAGTKTGLNNIASTFALMFAGSYLMTGINPFGKDMPDNNKGKYLPVYKKGDTVTSLKIDRVIPYAEWLNPMHFGEAPLEAMGTMATAPIVKAVSDTKNLILNRKIPINDFTNRPVTYSNKPLGEKTYDISKYMVQQHTPLPATASNVWNFIESLARTQKQRKTNDTFVPRSTTQEIIKLLGPNLSNHSIKGLNADRKRKERREKKRAK